MNTNKIFNGAIITVTMRWTDRLIGLVSTVFLARLLVPSDFGIVAMAMLVVGFVDVFLSLGVNQVLIHNNDAQKEDYDTAWTVRLIQAICVAIIVFVTAPLAVEYFDSPNVENVLRVMCLSILIGGLENIGIITFQKEMNFGRDFKFFFFKRIVGFVVTLTIAVIFKTYWAMVLGSMAGRIAGVLLSYGMHSFRPNLSLVRLREIWSFSQWVLFQNIGAYFNYSISRLLIGSRLSPEILGGYTVASEVASMPTTELLAPIGRVLFPAFVDKRDDKMAFASRVTQAIGVQALVALPACVGLMCVAHDLVYVVLGEKWMFAAPLVQIMALSNLVVALAHSCGYALLALGKVKVQALIVWFQALLFLLVVLIFGGGATAEKFAVIQLFAVAAGSTALVGFVLFEIEVLRVGAFISALLRPLFASVVMMASLYYVHPFFTELPVIFRLFVEVAVGGCVYIVMVCLTWLLAKRPKGAEAYLVSNVANIWR